MNKRDDQQPQVEMIDEKGALPEASEKKTWLTPSIDVISPIKRTASGGGSDSFEIGAYATSS